jgi:aminoglycoside 2'-N-acetyltransferase I
VNASMTSRDHSPLVEAPSDALDASMRRDLRAFLDAAYDDEFTGDDWAHALGGVHVWVAGLDGIASHASVVPRTLVCSGAALRVGYVEAVATAAARRGHGYATKVMRRIGDLIHERYALGALSTGVHGFYARLGWERWRGATFVATPSGPLRTPDEDEGIMILRTPRTPPLDLSGDIVADWREGDVW